jgi:uncharacterized protein YndB with AHSA1/START domain
MTVTNIDKDLDALTMTITAEFDSPIERVWDLWANPRLLERWWGPPTYPATFLNHDLVPGGSVTYFMTGPEGDKHGGWWRIVSVDVPNHLTFEDGFADDTGRPNADMPVTAADVRLLTRSVGGTRMVITSTFASRDNMEQLLAMGMDEGMKAAMGQMDGLLASPTG